VNGKGKAEGRESAGSGAAGMMAVSKQGFETRSLEVPVVGEGFREAQAPHDRKRNVVHNPCVVSLAVLIGAPGDAPIRLRGHDQAVAFLHVPAESVDGGAIWPPRGGVAAFEQDEARSGQLRAEASSAAKEAWAAWCHWSLSSQTAKRPTVSRNTV